MHTDAGVVGIGEGTVEGRIWELAPAAGSSGPPHLHARDG